ncbi:FAD-dependent oxidoreductase [Thermodesulfobacteriota bacterium]
MSSKKIAKTGKVEAELVIIGGGGAGLAAALAMAEKGVSDVIVLEKRSVVGGNTALATGLFACESPVQKQEKIIADKDELFKKSMGWAHWSRIDPRICRAFLNKSGDTIRWLEDKGVEFDIRAFYPNQEPRVWHCPKGRGAQLIKVLAEKCKELGVRLFQSTSGKKILRSVKGDVTGVLAIKDGEEFEIITKGIIITSGGFAGNKELLKKYCPSYYDGMPLRGLPLTGDGLLMAAETGAYIEDYVTLLKEGPRVELNGWPLIGLVMAPSAIWVNKKGKRFIDESVGFHPFESVNAILLQPDKVSYTLIDDSIRQDFEEKGIKMGRLKHSGQGPKIHTSELEKKLQEQANKGRVKISESWDGIAAWIGADPKALKDTIDEYNSFCSQGYDEIFSKGRRYLMPLRSTPYYAIRGMPVFLDTMGGIKVNDKMEVLNNVSNPVPGLYAAGVVVSGWEAESYCSDLSGSAFGFAINSGRIAGENAVVFILGK